MKFSEPANRAEVAHIELNYGTTKRWFVRGFCFDNWAPDFSFAKACPLSVAGRRPVLNAAFYRRASAFIRDYFRLRSGGRRVPSADIVQRLERKNTGFSEGFARILLHRILFFCRWSCPLSVVRCPLQLTTDHGQIRHPHLATASRLRRPGPLPKGEGDESNGSRTTDHGQGRATVVGRCFPKMAGFPGSNLKHCRSSFYFSLARKFFALRLDEGLRGRCPSSRSRKNRFVRRIGKVTDQQMEEIAAAIPLCVGAP